ncbi:hypothetical protein DFP72DRAFT_803918 [Ephemerocybe angulata]|uniref:BTB domain-containing protein n=1 Tax=Ephemerocybe angulata TaxID=980116 RepID=A0A8H6IB11_9AGAR|nr:hypothetical protein DFP72DRAFT_803918 [Tulosesus angulatus]
MSPVPSTLVYRHPRFFFQDGNVIFMVEGTLFKVHKFFFQRDSPIFNSMFTLPPPNNDRPEGEVEDNPIVLQGFKATDFERFLSILYPLNFLNCDLTTADEWTSVLAISSMWEFASLRLLAIDKLSHITNAVDRIALGKRFDLPHWVTPAYFDLCTRGEPLNQDEGEKLGMADVIKIGQIRHQIRYVTNLNRHEDTIVTLVKEMFS